MLWKDGILINIKMSAVLIYCRHFLQKTWIFVRSWEGAEQLWISQDRILHLDQLKRHLSCAQHLRFAAMAGEDDDLARIRLLQPLERGVQPVFIVEHEAVVEDQRKTSGFGAVPMRNMREGDFLNCARLVSGRWAFCFWPICLLDRLRKH